MFEYGLRQDSGTPVHPVADPCCRSAEAAESCIPRISNVILWFNLILFLVILQLRFRLICESVEWG